MTEKFEELNLPNAVITRIIKEAIPPGSIVSKECILYLTPLSWVPFCAFALYHITYMI